MLLEPLPKDADEEWRKRITHTEINIKAVKAYAVEWAKTLADEVLKKGLGAEKQVVEKMQSKRIELLTMADKVGATRYIEEAIKILEVGKTKKENNSRNHPGEWGGSVKLTGIDQPRAKLKWPKPKLNPFGNLNPLMGIQFLVTVLGKCL